MNPITTRAFYDELEKIAARAGLQVIRNLIAKGTPEAMAQANRLAKAPGVLKATAAGSQVKHLGAGGEGIADLVAHPQFGVSVRKLYNPTSSIASPTMIGRKAQMAKQLQSPMLAETHGVGRTGRGGRMSFNEYVPGGSSSPQDVDVIQQHLRSKGALRGWDLQDIRDVNVQGGKAIDVLPFRGGETVGQSGGRIISTPKGMKALNTRRAGAVSEAPQAPGLSPEAAARRQQYLKNRQTYRLLGSGKGRGDVGGTAKPLSQVPAAPQRAPINVPAKNPNPLEASPEMQKNISSGFMDWGDVAPSSAIKSQPKLTMPTTALPKPSINRGMTVGARAP
jgi:hypothetical protein